MLNLIKYELKKVFGINKGIFGILTIFAIAIMIIVLSIIKGNPRIDPNSFKGIVLTLSYTTLIVFFITCFTFPIIKSIYSKYKDLNSATAPLESHIPLPGWKKLYAKIIADLVFIIVGLSIAFICFLGFVAIFTTIEFKNIDKFKMLLNTILQSFPNLSSTVANFFIILFGRYVPFLTIFTGSAVLNASIRNKTKFNKSIVTVITISVIFLWAYLDNKIVNIIEGLPFTKYFRIPYPRTARELRTGSVSYMEGNQTLVLIFCFVISAIAIYFIGRALDRKVDL